MKYTYDDWMKKNGNDRSVVLYSETVLYRNLTDTPFVFGCEEKQKEAIFLKIKEALLDAGLAHTLYLVPLENMTPSGRACLTERGYIQRNTVENPRGCGLFLSEDGSMALTVNEEDHLRVCVTLPGRSLEETYRQAEQLETHLSSVLSFAFDSEFGYLSPQLQRLGTGLQTSVYVHVPALCESGNAARVWSSLKRIGFTVEPVYSDGEHAFGDLYRITNAMTLGIQEKEQVDNLNNVIQQVIRHELALREEWQQDEAYGDRVYRAMGTLLYARRVSYAEAMELLSLIRFGMEQGLWKQMAWWQWDMLIRQIQPASLALPERSAAGAYDEQRAILIRQFLSREDDEIGL